jgi:hypothetical protein
MFFADLTPYTYGYSTKPPQTHVLNVGWLSHEHPFTTGDVSDSFVRTLRRLISSPVVTPLITAMGFHECELCPPWLADEPRATWLLGNPPPPPGKVSGGMGNGELWVPGANNLVYVAPVLVVHYIEVHRYLPPQVFTDAVYALDVALAQIRGDQMNFAAIVPLGIERLVRALGWSPIGKKVRLLIEEGRSSLVGTRIIGTVTALALDSSATVNTTTGEAFTVKARHVGYGFYYLRIGTIAVYLETPDSDVPIGQGILALL